MALTLLLRVGWLRTTFGSPGVTRALPPTNKRGVSGGQTGSGDGCERFAGLPLARVGITALCGSLLGIEVTPDASVGMAFAKSVAVDSAVGGTAGPPPSEHARTLKVRKVMAIETRRFARLFIITWMVDMINIRATIHVFPCPCLTALLWRVFQGASPRRPIGTHLRKRGRKGRLLK